MPTLAVGGVGDQPLNPEMIAGAGSCRASAHAARRLLGTLPPPSLMEARRSHGHGLVVPCVHIPGIRPAHGCDVEDGGTGRSGIARPGGPISREQLARNSQAAKTFQAGFPAFPAPSPLPRCANLLCQLGLVTRSRAGTWTGPESPDCSRVFTEMVLLRLQ